MCRRKSESLLQGLQATTLVAQANTEAVCNIAWLYCIDVYRSICLSIYLSISSIHPSIYLSLYTHTYLYISIYMCIFIHICMYVLIAGIERERCMYLFTYLFVPRSALPRHSPRMPTHLASARSHQADGLLPRVLRAAWLRYAGCGGLRGLAAGEGKYQVGTSFLQEDLHAYLKPECRA